MEMEELSSVNFFAKRIGFSEQPTSQISLRNLKHTGFIYTELKQTE